MKKTLVPETVTLSVYDKECTSYGVCWMTREAGCPVVEYTDEKDVGFSSPTRVRGETVKLDEMFRNTAVIKDVIGGRRYLWRVGDGSGVFSAPDVFTAVDNTSDALCFLVFADTQDRRHNGKLWQLSIKDAWEHFPDAVMSLHGGDVVESERYRRWRLVTQHNKTLFRKMPMLPVTGNHDHMVQSDGVFHKYFNICKSADTEEKEIYYSVDAGPVHFTMLSTGDYAYTDRHGLREEQIRWARSDIASTDKPWKIVMLHTPMYSPGQWGAHPTQPFCLREQLNAMFAELGVDMVITGHDHIYCETYPITGDGCAEHGTKYETRKINGEFYRIAVSPAGPIHMIPGCCGNQGRSVERSMDSVETGYYRDVVDIKKTTVSYGALRICGDVLTVDFVVNRASDGERVLVRRFGISK